MKYKKQNAFTFVELMVVVTIVAILSVIGFVSYNSYISGSRDTNRIVMATQSFKQLQAYGVLGRYPIPESVVELRSSGSVIGYQGLLDIQVQQEVGLSDIYDPLDESFLAYSVNASRRYAQVTTFLEGGQNAVFSMLSSSSADPQFASRYPYVVGDRVGFIYSNDNSLPLDAITVNQNTGFVELSNDPSNYTIYFPSGESVSGDGGLIVSSMNTSSSTLVTNNNQGQTSCNIPWGGSIEDGQNITAFLSSSVPFGDSCQQENRVCNNGNLSGSYQNQTCGIETASSCTTPWGAIINDGASVFAFSATSVPQGQNCTSVRESRSCSNGVLSGSFANQTCFSEDTTPAAFTFTDQTGVELSTVITSNSRTITGINTGTPVSVSGAGNPTVSINGGAYSTSGTIQNNQSLTVRMTSSNTYTTAQNAIVNVGGVTDTWTVTTRAAPQGAQSPLVTWNGTSGINSIGVPASNTYNVFNLYFASASNITIADQNATINGNHSQARNITVGNGNSIIRIGNAVNSVQVGNGDNRFEIGSFGTNSITLGNGSNTIISSGNDTITTSTSGTLAYTKNSNTLTNRYIWRGGNVTVSNFNASNRDIIDFSQLAEITDYNDLITSHLLQNTPVGGFTIQSSLGTFVVQNYSFTLDEADFAF